MDDFVSNSRYEDGMKNINRQSLSSWCYHELLEPSFSPQNLFVHNFEKKVGTNDSNSANQKSIGNDTIMLGWSMNHIAWRIPDGIFCWPKTKHDQIGNYENLTPFCRDVLPKCIDSFFVKLIIDDKSLWWNKEIGKKGCSIWR